LIVEDDAIILNTLAYNLSREGFTAHKASDGSEALKLTRQLRPDLILLDLMLPGEDGIRVCEKIRRDDSDTVIIMVTAKDSERDKVRGLEAGADDYVTKPFGMKELVARINANLKRSGISSGARGKIIEVGDLLLDTKNFTAQVKGKPLSLRLKEFELLAALASQPGELKSREELAKEVWGHAAGQQDPARLRRERLPRAKDPGNEPQTPGRESGRDLGGGSAAGTLLRRSA
jgi:DNA-binding response OmpR family regulator